MSRRFYSSTFVPTTITSSIVATDTAITVAASSGAPAVPFTGVFERGTSNEDLVTVTAVAGTSYTIVRNVDGQTAKAHQAGAAFEHVVSARDFDEPNAHINDTTRDDHPQYGLVKKGLNAIRGAAGRSMKFFYNTDSGLLSLDDGSAWHDFQDKATADAAYQAAGAAILKADPATATVVANESTSSATFTDLATAGPAVTVTTGARALVIVKAQINGDAVGTGCDMGYAVSGASTIAASNDRCLRFMTAVIGPPQFIRASEVTLQTGLTPGSNTFTAKYARTGGAGNAFFVNRSIIVIPL